MRTTGLLVVAAAAAAHAGYTEKDGKYICEEPNASYCLGGDIILRCDAYGVGTPGRCSDNLSGYPPAGGVASCYEKAGTHGEAACEKNCVVYYIGAPYTLPAELCHPSQTSSAVDTLTTIYTHSIPETTAKPYHNTTSPGNPGKPGESSKPGHPGYPSNSTQPAQPGHPTATGYTTKCVTIVYPNPTNTVESKTRTITYTSAVYAPPGTETSEPQYPPNTTMYPVPSGSPPPPPHNSTCPTCHGGPGGHGGKGIYFEQTNQAEKASENAEQGENGESPSGSETKVPVSPTSTTEPDAVTGAGSMNTVSGLLALVAVVAAYLI